MAEISVIGLINGQDVIGEIEYNPNSNIYKVKKPKAIIVRQQPDGTVGTGLVPWPVLANQSVVDKTGVSVNADIVVYLPIEPDPNLLQGYRQAVSSLVVPNQKGLILG